MKATTNVNLETKLKAKGEYFANVHTKGVA